ncbi:MAG TPA: CNNM domain-containing protein [Arenimonas sp.]|nr:CNNM domain-containing protein [Arenimonas sp.]
MNDIPLSLLFGLLFVLLLLSSFFSGSETALMALNRYRLRHLAKTGNRGAQFALRLLEKPDRLIGLILLGNNLVNNSAAMLATLIALRIADSAGLPIGPATTAAAVMLTVVMLIFSEVAPKTVAAYHPERFGFPAAFVLTPLLRFGLPFVWLISKLAGAVLWVLKVRPRDSNADQLSPEELRTLLAEGGGMIRPRNRRMLLNILELDELTVDEVMVPRREILGLDLDEPIEAIVDQLQRFPYSRIPVYRDSIDKVFGILNPRQLLSEVGRPLDKALIESRVRKPYFIPSGTPLTRQLSEFQKRERRAALVVDEYGDLLGLVTIEDILEEIVGEFTSDPGGGGRRIEKLPDGSIRADGRVRLRVLNRRLGWNLPLDGASTLNGLILEARDAMPEQGSEFELHDLRVRMERVEDNVAVELRIWPQVAPASAI